MIHQAGRRRGRLAGAIRGPMDLPNSEEDDIETGSDPLEVVEHVLNAENLSFDRTEDGDLAFALTGDWKDYELWFAWRPEADCLQLCLALDLQALKAQRTASCCRWSISASGSAISRSGPTMARWCSATRLACRTANGRRWPRPPR